MTALKGKAIDGFLAKRDPAICAVLVYGPDAGLVKERADKLAKAVTPDFKDAFNYIELTDADVKAEPGRLADEAMSLSFMGGERVVRIRTTGDGAHVAAKTLVDGAVQGHVKVNGLVIIEGGDLAKTSKLRKLFEGAKKAAVALPCYADGAGDVRALALNTAQAEDLRFEPDALDLLVSLLGADRGLSRAEVDKLILYKGPKETRSGPAVITVTDVKESLVDTIGDAMDAVAAAAADGRALALSRALARSAAAGGSPIAALRALQRSFSRLDAAAGHITAGSSAADAMARLRPPVFFMEKKPFEARLQRWSKGKTERALDLLVEAELAAKTTGAPQREIVERTALQLAALARR